MSLNEFVNKYNGVEVDTDGAYGGQCMDLMHQYIVGVLGLPLSLFAAPTAYEAYKNANDPRFDKIPNTPDGVPQPGDIVFWNTGVGSAGHVAVFIEGDTNNFKSFDQNWPTGSFCHEQNHDYKSVAGWLHPKNAPTQGTVAVDSDTFKQLVDKSTKYDSFNAAGYTTVDDVNKKVGDVTHERDEANKAIITLNSKIDDLTSAIQKDAVEDKDLMAENIDLQHKLEEKAKPIEQEVKPLQEHALSLQNALDGLIYKRAPKKSQSLLTRIVNKLFVWFA